MLLSMTGFGEAHCHQQRLAVVVEARTVNNRYFKLSVRLPDGYSMLEPQVDALVRQQIRRGTVSLNVRIHRDASPDDFRLNASVLAGYFEQLNAAYDKLQMKGEVNLESLLALPGVVDDQAAASVDYEQDWPIIGQAIGEALTSLMKFRTDEGKAMATDLRANCKTIAENLDAIHVRAPLVIESYRGRLIERLNKLVAEFNVTVQASDIVREIALFTERSDISEEIVRLRSHLEQFEQAIVSEDSAGRKLDFLSQEMFRETNTIGSKANDAEISKHVIEIKTAIERVREMVQNVE